MKMRIFPNSIIIAVVLVNCLLGFSRGQYTGELLIVCDKDFSARFQNNRSQILNYWASYMWDVNMKFKSIPDISISFRVTDLIIITDRNEQPFIENSKDANGMVSTGSVLKKFAEWNYKHKNRFKKFDIAVLATAASANGTHSSHAYIKTVCQSSFWSGINYSSLLVRFQYSWSNSCNSLMWALASLLGATDDSKTEAYLGCRNNSYVMSSNCGKNHYFFSKCSSAAITSYFKSSYSVDCLRNDGSQVNVLRDEIPPSGTPVAPTFQKQCQIITNNVTATVGNTDENQCIMSSCYMGSGTNRTFVKHLYPVDNSPCGDSKRCFRGRCLAQGFRIRHIVTNKCLRSDNNFVSNDFPVMNQCAQFPTPLDRLMINDKNDKGKTLSTPYSTPDARENEDKCLSVDITGERVQFTKCNAADLNEDLIAWKLIRVDDQTFLLFHQKIKACATVDSKFIVKFNSTCSLGDKNLHWKIHERYSMSLGLLDSVTNVLNLSSNEILKQEAVKQRNESFEQNQSSTTNSTHYTTYVFANNTTELYFGIVILGMTAIIVWLVVQYHCRRNVLSAPQNTVVVPSNVEPRVSYQNDLNDILTFFKN